MTTFLKTFSLRLASSLLLATLLTACGGQSQSGGSANPPPATNSTLAQQIEEAENSGAYPKLDRSSDIAGPDANSNGVRDDIEAWINAQPVSDPQRKALMQDARALQQTLLVDLSDKAALDRSGDQLMASGRCGSLKFTPFEEFSKRSEKIEAMTANTRERAMRYIQYNKASSGSSNTLPNGDTCEP